MRDLYELIFAELRGSWRFRWIALGVAWLVCLSGWFVVYSLPDEFGEFAQHGVDLYGFKFALRFEGLFYLNSFENIDRHVAFVGRGSEFVSHLGFEDGKMIEEKNGENGGEKKRSEKAIGSCYFANHNDGCDGSIGDTGEKRGHTDHG